MSNFVKLTHKQGSPVWINPTYVEMVLTAEAGTRVIMSGTAGRFDVQESLDAVMQMLGVTVEAEPSAAASSTAELAAPERPARRARGSRR